MRRLYRNAGATAVFGTPTIAYGEARAVGGTTVVNGGLFWEPSRAVLDRWASWSGYGGYRSAVVGAHFGDIQRELGMIVQEHGDGNEDSRLLARAAESLGWRWQHPQRVVRGCEHRNQCATGCPSGAKQSMAVSYLPQAEALGADIVPGRASSGSRTAGAPCAAWRRWTVRGAGCATGRATCSSRRAPSARPYCCAAAASTRARPDGTWPCTSTCARSPGSRRRSTPCAAPCSRRRSRSTRRSACSSCRPT
ncbi:GMC family oxidoreductase N-terminal domain-containing protein [Streptomyces diastatochromogenes]|nr:GMC family oxidoreductase N-terminal domain-containing protein [Streptomyces diastatochromogenes]